MPAVSAPKQKGISYVRFRDARIQFLGSRALLMSKVDPFRLIGVNKKREPHIRKGELGVGKRIIRIDINRMFEIIDRVQHMIQIAMIESALVQAKKSFYVPII